MTYPTEHTFHRAEETLVRILYVIGEVNFMLGGNH